MKVSKGYRVFQVMNAVIMLSVIVVTVYPLLYLAAKSFSSEAAVYAGKVTVFPVGFTTKAYQTLMKSKDFFVTYKNTILYAVIGTVIALTLSSMLAYALSKSRPFINRVITPLVVFTLLFAGGMIPNFVLIQALGLRNSMWAIILPMSINTYYILIMRSFFQGLPGELEEAAQIDGLNTFGVFFRVILPLSKPILATMLLFYAVDYWNEWFPAFLYLDDKSLWPVTLYVRQIVEGASSANIDPGALSQDASQVAATIRSASMILTTLPIVCIYPFVQKYFVQGMMMGSVKG